MTNLVEEQEKLSAAEAQIVRLQAELEQERAKVVRWINRNAHLWTVLAKLPGGVEAARERGVTQ